MYSQSQPHDGEFHDLEERLRVDVQRLAAPVPKTETVSAILNEYLRRRRRARSRRRAAIVGSGCLLALTVALVLRTSWTAEFFAWRARPPSPPSTAKQPAKVPVAAHPLNGAGTNWGGRTGVAALPSSTAEATSSSTALYSALPDGHLPAWIVTIDDNGRPVAMPGVYVPGRVETIRLDDLSPPLRRAATMVLGLDETGIEHDPI